MVKMKPTNEERCEIAGKLRKVANTLGENMDGHEFAHYVADAVLKKRNIDMAKADYVSSRPNRA